MSIEGVRSTGGWEKTSYTTPKKFEKPDEQTRTEPRDTLEKSGSPKKPGLIKKFTSACKKGVNKTGDGISNFISKYIMGDEVEGEHGIFKGYNGYPGSHNKMHDHTRYVAVGATSGGAIGTGVGLFSGYEDMCSDEVQMVWKDNEIGDPKLDGYSHWSHETGYYVQDYAGTDSEGRAIYNDRWVSTGYDHDFSPKISYDKVGSYKTPEYVHSSKWSPLTGGLVGLLAGTAVGGLVGLAVSVAHKVIKNHKNS